MKLSFSKAFSIAAISFLGILIYSNTLHSPFLFDDERNIVNNFSIRSLSNLKAIWDYYPTRFITYFSFAINYHFSKPGVFSYHLFNIFVHLSSALAVWWLALLTLATPAIKDQKIAKHSDLIALFAGLLFVSHPIQTESVTYIIQRATSLAALFYILSVCLYAKSRLSKNRTLALPCCALSLLSALLAMFTKEIAITLPLAIGLYEFSFLNAKERFNWKRIIPFLFTLLIIPLTMLAYKSLYFGAIKNEVEANAGISPLEYLFTQFRVIMTYIRLVFFPINQNLDYDFRISRTLFEPSVLLSLGLIILFLTAATRLFQKHRLVSFGVFWFFLTLLPESSIMPIRDVIYEHRLYLPMAGFSIFLVSAVYDIVGKKSIKPFIAILSIAVIAYSILTYNRNIIWKDGLTFWNDVVLKSPGKARPYNNRGNAYQAKGEFDKAISDHNKVLEIKPDCSEAYYNRAQAYQPKGLFDRAISDYSAAVKIDPNFFEAYNNRGNTYKNKGELDKAVSDYNHALQINPACAGAYNNRATAYFDKKEYDKTWEDVRRAEILGYKVNPTFIMNLKKASGKNN